MRKATLVIFVLAIFAAISAPIAPADAAGEKFDQLRSHGIKRTCGTLPGDGAYSYITTVGIRCAPAKRIAFRAHKRFCKRHDKCLIVPPAPISTIFKGRIHYRGWTCNVKDGWELLVVGCKKRDMRFSYRTAA